MHIERTEEPPADWEAMHGEDSRATLFLHPRWMRALTRAHPHYRPLYLVAREGTETVAFLPMVRAKRAGLDQFLSLPFGTHGGPLLRRGAGPETVAALGSTFRDLGSGLRVLRFEMTIYDPSPEWRHALAPFLGDFFREIQTHVIDLPSLSGRYRRSAERSLHAAERAGIRVGLEQGEAAFEVLARMHAAQVRNWPGVEPYAPDVIASVAGSFGEEARLYVARKDGQALAACLCLEHAGREIHPWVSGALPESREEGAFHLLMDVALRDAARRGLTVWHFGGSGGIPGVEFFKESFGARRVPVLRCFHLAGWARRLRPRPAWDA
jgi:CelD/BcsL family acetyltransferase involved in cellulose biosynthesis